MLLVDPAKALRAELVGSLTTRFQVERVADPQDAKELHYELAIIAPEIDGGLGICWSLVGTGKASDVVVLGKDPQLSDAIAAIRARASDFVPDGADATAVLSAIDEVIDRRRIREQLQRLRERPAVEDDLPELAGQSQAMRELRARIEKVVGSDTTVLLVGEPGTGRETVARALHDHGPRRGQPFVSLRCEAVDAATIDADLFGARAVNGVAERAGKLAQAAGGTLYLGDIAALSLEAQDKLAAALASRTVPSPSGGREASLDVRVVASTSRDPERDVAEGKLRADLLSRLRASLITLPPLRDREDDVLLLAQRFLTRASTGTRRLRGVTPAAGRALLQYAWPGNVAELERSVAAASTKTKYDHLTLSDLPEKIRAAELADAPPSLDPLSRVQQRHILDVLDSVGGNKAHAAKLLGLDRKTLYRKLKQYEASGVR